MARALHEELSRPARLRAWVSRYIIELLAAVLLGASLFFTVGVLRMQHAPRPAAAEEDARP